MCTLNEVNIEAIVNLGIGGEPPSLKNNEGLNRRELALAARVVAANNQLFLESWIEIHGEI